MDLELVANDLMAAEASRVPIAPITDQWPDMTLTAAYHVQQLVIERKLARGDRVVGHKVGLTGRAMQEQLGIDQPDFGHLLGLMAVENRGEVRITELIQPRVEQEIGLLLARRLEGPGVTVGGVLAATEAVFPTIEIIDSRITDWRIRLADTVADNASSARFVEASRLSHVRGLELDLLGGVLEVDGVVVDSGVGAAVLGHPARAVAWLANVLATFDLGLDAGSIVLPGAIGRSAPVRAGNAVRAEFDRIGSVAVRFVDVDVTSEG